jgi:hypothetical protein
MSDDIKPSDEESLVDLTQTDGDVSEDTSDAPSDVLEILEDSGDEDELTDEQKAIALKAINQVSGKNFTSLEKAAKSLHHAEVLAAEKGKQKETVKPVESATAKDVPSDNQEVIEELLLTRFPEAQQVLQNDKLRGELEALAKAKGVSILKIYRESGYFQSEGKALAAAVKEEEQNRSKISKPATATDFKVKLEDVKEADVAKLTPAQKMKWIQLQAAKERSRAE